MHQLIQRRLELVQQLADEGVLAVLLVQLFDHKVHHIVQQTGGQLGPVCRCQNVARHHKDDLFHRRVHIVAVQQRAHQLVKAVLNAVTGHCCVHDDVHSRLDGVQRDEGILQELFQAVDGRAQRFQLGSRILCRHAGAGEQIIRLRVDGLHLVDGILFALGAVHGLFHGQQSFLEQLVRCGGGCLGNGVLGLFQQVIKRLEQFVRLVLAHGFFQRGVQVVVELIQRGDLFQRRQAVIVHNAVDLFLGFSDQLDELFILGGFPQFFQCAGSVDILDKVFILLGNFFQRGDLILIGAIAVQDIVQVLDGAVDQVFFQSVQHSGQLIGNSRQIGAQRLDGLLCFVVSLFDLFRIAACNGILESFQRLFCHGLLYGFLGFFDDLTQSRLENGVLADLIGQILDLRSKSLDLINGILTDLAV